MSGPVSLVPDDHQDDRRDERHLRDGRDDADRPQDVGRVEFLKVASITGRNHFCDFSFCLKMFLYNITKMVRRTLPIRDSFRAFHDMLLHLDSILIQIK